MSPEISPRNSFDGYWGTMPIEPFSSPNANDVNQSEIYSDTPATTNSSHTEENCENKSNFDIPKNDWDARLSELDLENTSPDEKRLLLLKSV